MKSDIKVTTLPPDLPASLRTVLRRCVEKDPRERLRDIGDVRLAMEGAFETTLTVSAEPVTESSWWSWALPSVFVALIVGSIVGGFVVWSLTSREPPSVAPTMRFDLTSSALPPAVTASYRDAAISPDGSRVVYLSGTGPSDSALVVRVLGEQVGRVLDATASPSAVAPFISPDSEWVGFYDIRARTLGRISIHGGSATSIGTLPSRGQLVGASWGADDTIIFGTRQPNGLWRIPVSGGEAEAVTTTEGTENHVWPEVLPGGRTVLFTIQIGNDLAGARVAVLDLETGTQEVLISGGHAAQYVSSGHLVYASGNTLWAVGFDPTSLTITTDPIPVLDDVLVKPFGVASFSVSDTGSLVAVSGSVVGDSNQLVWVDRAGVETFLFEDSNTRSFRNPRISPDGQQVSVVVNERPTVFGGWFLDLRRGVLQRLGVSGDASLPVLSPSGDQAVFARQEAGEVRNLFRLFMDGSAVPERLTTSEHLQIPTSWTPDGASLVFVQSTAASDNDIWVLPMDGDGEQWMFRGTESDETQAMLSPDGNWIAYRSDASGRDEIYVEPFPDGGLPRLVSSGGGTEPVWARDMSELFYRNGTSVMAVSLVVGSGLIAGVPMQLFDGPYELTALRYSNYDVDLDGSRFVMVKPGSRGTSSAQTRVNLTLNWHQELLERVPIN